MAPASRKYIARRPRMANTFEVNTSIGSRVSAKIAGTESTAKTMSEASRNRRATRSGVACHRPASRTKNDGPCASSVTGTRRRNRRTSGFFPGSIDFLAPPIILMPETMSTTPKKMTTALCCISTEPSAMNPARKTSAPMIP